MGIVTKGSKIAVVTGWKTGPGSTNTVRVMTVDKDGEFVKN